MRDKRDALRRGYLFRWPDRGGIALLSATIAGMIGNWSGEP